MHGCCFTSVAVLLLDGWKASRVRVDLAKFVGLRQGRSSERVGGIRIPDWCTGIPGAFPGCPIRVYLRASWTGPALLLDRA